MPAPSGPASGPQEYSNAPLPPLSWEGEKMYVYFNFQLYGADGRSGSTSISMTTASREALGRRRVNCWLRLKSHPTQHPRSMLAKGFCMSEWTLLTHCRYQGLMCGLTRWWSVFWVLFQAKSNAQGGTEDAQMYNMVGLLILGSRHLLTGVPCTCSI